MTVTTELLDALLSPAGAGGQHSPRAQAEHHLSSLGLADRAAGLLNLLLTAASSSSDSQPNSHDGPPGQSQSQSRAMLSAVLLRRDIATLGGNARSATGLDDSTALRMMREMAAPLLQLFLAGGAGGNGGTAKTTRRQVGHCLAELCLSCSVLGAAIGGAGAAASGVAVANEVMAQVLTGIGPGVSFCICIAVCVCVCVRGGLKESWTEACHAMLYVYSHWILPWMPHAAQAWKFRVDAFICHFCAWTTLLFRWVWY